MELIHKRSRERRSSKRSLRSSAGSLVDTGKIDLSGIIERRLQMVLEEEQQQLIIYAVREELMQRVMEECHKKYMEKQCVKFSVHCAHRALVQIVNLGLFHHDPGKPFYNGHPSWMDDKPPEPSPADSWAVRQVPIKRKPIPKPLVLPPDGGAIKSAKEEHFDNVFTGIEVQNKESISEVELIYESEKVEEYEEIESELYLSCPPVTEASLPVEEEPLISTGSVQPLSIFTQTTKMPKEYLPHSMKSARSKIKGLATKITEPPVLITDEVPSEKSKLSISALPPLRSDAKYKENIQNKESDKELDKMPPDSEN